MSVWRERGYVPDSDEEEEESGGLFFDRNDGHDDDRDTDRRGKRHDAHDDGGRSRDNTPSDVASQELGLSAQRKWPQASQAVQASTIDHGDDHLCILSSDHDEAPPSPTLSIPRRHDDNDDGNKGGRLPKLNKYTKIENPSLEPIVVIPQYPSTTDVGNFFPSSLPTDIDVPELPPSSTPLQPQSQPQPRPDSPSLGRRASVSSSDLSDVDLHILASSHPPYDRFSSTHDAAFRALAAPVRNFRTRKAIQLHPYLLEQEKYRQALKARGYRPVHVATSQQRPQDHAEDTQEQEFNNDGFVVSNSQKATQETTPPDSSESSMPTQVVATQYPRYRRDRPLLRLSSSDEEEAGGYERPLPAGIQYGAKRRKTLDTPVTSAHSLPHPSSASASTGKLPSLSLAQRSLSLHAPSSPPSTSSPPSLDDTPLAVPRFRRPRGLTPLAIETPVPSSPPPPGRTESSRRPPQTLSDSDSDRPSNPSASPAPAAEEMDIQRMRKRIRGVLPASWLNLDRKTQRTPSHPTHNHKDDTPKPPVPVKGVAQRVSSANASLRRKSTIVLSDDSEMSDASLPKLPPIDGPATTPHSPRLRQLKPFDDTAEVEEYDEIDRMLPNPTRASNSKRSKKTQSRLTDAFVRAKDGEHQRNRVSGPTTTGSGNRAGAKKIRPWTRRPQRPVQLSILDVNPDVTRQPKGQPKFLRLAARQARKRPDLARQSPTQKTVRLATHDDTLDAVLPLKSWREGRLKPATFVDLFDEEIDPADRMSLSTSTSIRRALERANMSTHARIASDTSRNAIAKAKRRALRPKQAFATSLRPGQLETMTSRQDPDRDLLTFAPPPSRLLQIFRKDRADGPPLRFRLERFLEDRDTVTAGGEADNNGDVAMQDVSAVENRSAPRKGRKRLARRVDVELRTFRQPSEPIPVEIASDSAPPLIVNACEVIDEATLQGLGPSGTRYPVDFDVRPLEMGTYFHPSTFIGSGGLADALSIEERDLDLPAGRITIPLREQTLEWSGWNEDVSAGLASILEFSSSSLQSLSDVQDHERNLLENLSSWTTIDRVLKLIIKYCSECLYFIDPVDRLSCLTRFSRFVADFEEILQDHASNLRQVPDHAVRMEKTLLDSTLYLLCLRAQLVHIAQPLGVDIQTQTDLMQRLTKTARNVLSICFPKHFSALRSFLEDHRRHARRETGIHDNEMAVKCAVVVNHVLSSVSSPMSLSGLLFEQYTSSAHLSNSVRTLDQIWYDIFTVQPILELDRRGIYHPGSRYQSPNEAWAAVRSLLDRSLKLSAITVRSGRSTTANEYVRTCFSRVYQFITRWGWRQCETVLGAIYDFFARNGFRHLHEEQVRGSPQFLEDLDKTPEIQLDNADPAFHIFLKLLVVGIQALQTILPKHKIRGFAWRFIPNHGRTYQKDQELVQSDLDALRNNHDLLCTLYWVLPPGSGPRLQMIQSLVDHTSSHQEACRLSVHAWALLARYHTANGQRFDDLNTLAAWFKDMLVTTMSQYRLARSEVETQYAAERAMGSTSITEAMVEATIASNQRSILAIVMDLLHALQQTVCVSTSWDISRELLELSGLIEVFDLFDAAQPKVFGPIAQALAVVQDLHHTKPAPQIVESQPTTEDSQEYGDWSYLEDIEDGLVETTVETRNSAMGFVHGPSAKLLSSAFGSDTSPDDDLLKTLVDTWHLIASYHVKEGVNEWHHYLDAYSPNSWFQLRLTDQRRKYTAYFLSVVVDGTPSILQEHRAIFLGTWLLSLLERESLLKFQHTLTSSLLNAIPDDVLLYNLPFASDGRTGRYNISLTDLRARRESLVECILSNMQASYSNAIESMSSTTQEMKAEYAEMLKQAMTFMRKNYEELQQASSTRDDTRSTAQGAYVLFVQNIISSMQQYTFDICKIDKFFVDSSAFPLPSHDPTYVVGRLKRYAFKLENSRARKELSMFMQTVSERAALDNEQIYLAGQLHQAMTGRGAVALRTFLMSTIFPAYIEAAQTHICGWILALPLIQATTAVFQDLFYDFNAQSDIEANIGALTAMLSAVLRMNLRCVQYPSLVEQPHILHLLGTSFRLSQSCLTVVDHVKRRSEEAVEPAQIIHLFLLLGRLLQNLFPFVDMAEHPDLDNPPRIPPPRHGDAARFSSDNLRSDLDRYWARRGSEYFVIRGNNTREVQVDLGPMEFERDIAMQALADFLNDYDVIFMRRPRVEDASMIPMVFL
ncbi:hypothetical protein AAFC00_006106 [Neodothiora populina]|uniref:Mus7/MMS22 family-domain-containing protein n=1 Tax=Neodothiora populina TaxID=2781224 RepID=A0ABR3P5E4_9PEZI